MNNTEKLIKKEYSIDNSIIEFVNKISNSLKTDFDKYEQIKEYNQIKIIKAMQKNKLSSTDFSWTTGYGYGDAGRDKTEKIYADIFKTEDALVRPSISSGTHALTLSLQGILLPGDDLFSITGKPYDTLQKVIGIKGDLQGTLKEFGIHYTDIELENNDINIEKVLNMIKNDTKMIMIQRSTGYSQRIALTVDQIKNAIFEIKNKFPNIIIMVDNCYGEFTEIDEPSEYGADITVGSLIKNPGGGIALSGGYIVGKTDLIKRISNRLTAPGLGKSVGLSYGTTRFTLQGLFLAPQIVVEAIKGAILFGEIFSMLGYHVFPHKNEKRSDIILGITFNNPDMLIEFCRAIQAASAVDSHVTPYPWDMPGYSNQVIMASGSFIDGSSIELSADAPLKEPFSVFYQGGLSYYQCKLAAMLVLQKFLEKGMIKYLNNL